MRNTITKWIEMTLPSVQPAIDFVWMEIARQRERLFLWAPVVLAIGIGFYFSLNVEPPLALGVVASLFSLSFLALSWPKQEEGVKFYLFMLIGAAMSLMSIGFLAAQVRTAMVYTPMVEKEIKYTDVIGTIESIEPLEEGAGSRVLLSHLEIEKLSPEKTPHYVRLRLRADEDVAAGQRIKALAGLNPPFDPVMPGAFDFQRYSYFKRIGAVGFIYRAPEILDGPPSSSWHLFWEKLRLRVNDEIGAHMAYPQSAVAQALITGKRKAISEEDQQAIRDAGLAHMLAISGLHVGLVAGVLFFFVRLGLASIERLALRYPIKKYAAFAALFGALFYTLMVGAPIPTQRAMMMTGVVLLAVMLDRTAISLRLVALAAVFVLLFSPDALTTASFQMSFAAVTALVAIYELMKPAMSAWYSNTTWWRTIALYFIGVCITTIIASAATAPFSLFHFQHFATLGNIANLIAVPLLAFIIMPMGVLALLLMPIGLEFLPLAVMGWGVEQMLAISHWVANMPNAVANTQAWPVSSLIWIVAGGLFFMLWAGKLRILSVVMMGVGILGINQFNQYDIFISSSHKLIGYHAENRDFYVSSRRSDRFVLENWERAVGLQEGDAKTWPREGNIAGGIECGEIGCRMMLKGKRIAFSHTPLAHAEDCAWADIVISKNALKDWECDAPVVIDKIDTWKHGAHGIHLELGQPAIVHRAQEFRGQRPWIIQR